MVSASASSYDGLIIDIYGNIYGSYLDTPSPTLCVSFQALIGNRRRPSTKVCSSPTADSISVSSNVRRAPDHRCSGVIRFVTAMSTQKKVSHVAGEPLHAPAHRLLIAPKASVEARRSCASHARMDCCVCESAYGEGGARSDAVDLLCPQAPVRPASVGKKPGSAGSKPSSAGKKPGSARKGKEGAALRPRSAPAGKGTRGS